MFGHAISLALLVNLNIMRFSSAKPAVNLVQLTPFTYNQKNWDDLNVGTRLIARLDRNVSKKNIFPYLVHGPRKYTQRFEP